MKKNKLVIAVCFQLLFISIISLVSGLHFLKSWEFKEIVYSTLLTLVLIILTIEYLKNMFKCNEQERYNRVMYVFELANIIFVSNIVEKSPSIIVNFSFPVASMCFCIIVLVVRSKEKTGESIRGKAKTGDGSVIDKK